MNTLSVITIIICVGSLIYGFTRGIVKEMSSVCGILLGIIVCRLFSAQATAVAAHLLGVEEGASSVSHYVASIVGNAGLFFIVWLGVFLVSRLVRGAIHAIHLGFIDSLLGAVFCAAKWLLVFSLVLNLIYIMAPAAGMWGSNPPEGLIKGILGYAPRLFGIFSTPEAPAA